MKLAGLLVALAGPAWAEPLGWSLAVSNDSIGEARDRWQSSSLQLGLVFGDAWTGRAPGGFGLTELRLRSDILTPERLVAPAAGDRRHAGVLAVGLHTHQRRGAWDGRAGVDVVAVGPQTGILGLQREVHAFLGFTVPRLDDYQVSNALRLQFSAEAGRPFGGGRWQMRPFIEGQAGPEDMVRAGLDVAFGALGRDDLLVRAAATGHRVPAVRGGGAEGLSLVFGGDVAQGRESLYLPEELGYRLTPLRRRLRAGLHYGGARFDAFYGLAWLGREFEAQREGQFVGTVQIGLAF